MIEPRAIHRLWAYLARPDRWKLHLGVGAGTVLMAGIALAPRAPAPVVKPPEETAAPLLRAEMQRRDTAAVFRDVHRLADRVGGAVVEFLAAPPSVPVVHPDFGLRPMPVRPRLGHGLVVSDEGDILTHASAIGRLVEVDVRLASGAEARASVTAHERDTGLVLLRLAAPGAVPAAPLAVAPPDPGDVVAAVTRGTDETSSAAQPVYVADDGPATLALAAFSEALSPGTPLFTLDGSAVAVVGDTPHAAWPAASAVDRLSGLATTGRGVPATIGVQLQSVSPRLRPLVSDVAVLVADLDESGPAAQAGIRAGDGLRAVNESAVDDLAAAVQAIASLPLEALSDIVVVRAGKELRLAVQARPTLAPPDVLPVVRPSSESGPPAERLFPPSALDAAGIPGDARVLAIDGRALSERAAVTYLQRVRGPRVLYLGRGGQRYFAAAEARP